MELKIFNSLRGTFDALRCHLKKLRKDKKCHAFCVTFWHLGGSLSMSRKKRRHMSTFFVTFWHLGGSLSEGALPRWVIVKCTFCHINFFVTTQVPIKLNVTPQPDIRGKSVTLSQKIFSTSVQLVHLHLANFSEVPNNTTCPSQCASGVLAVGIAVMIKSAEKVRLKGKNLIYFLSL